MGVRIFMREAISKDRKNEYECISKLIINLTRNSLFNCKKQYMNKSQQAGFNSCSIHKLTRNIPKF
jgi:hypothetical protein